MKDKWKPLRENLFRSVEPKVELVAITQPVGRYKELCTSDSLPGYVARQSHESKGTIEDDLRLDNDLVGWDHTTPYQATEFVFDVTNTSKSLQAQWTRHKIGVGWIYRSTRYVSASGNSFVYCTYDYLDDEEKVKALLVIDEQIAKGAIEAFDKKREIGASKEDSRKVMPVAFATNCYYFTNARALRHLFKLRLDKHAEWEIRRMTKMIWDVCTEWTPSLFEDFRELRESEF
ncbi:MAG: FAD-dependent thymidylate synthase [Patescibacteria group bacterium]